jgi:RNA polymerase sporulation-specific sigma factor
MNILEIIKNLYSKYINKEEIETNSIFYIAGSQTLPPPLTNEEEEKMLEKLSQNDEEAKKTLVERNLRLVVYISKKFENTGVGIEDLISIGTIGLMKAINTFNTGKNIKLATYASRCIENEILMYLRKSSKIKGEVSIDEPLNQDGDGNELLLSDILGTENDITSRGIEDEVDKKLLKASMEKLNKREKNIMELRFGFINGNEKTQKEVADMLGISQSYISRLEKKIIGKMKKEIMSKTRIKFLKNNCIIM